MYLLEKEDVTLHVNPQPMTVYKLLINDIYPNVVLAPFQSMDYTIGETYKAPEFHDVERLKEYFDEDLHACVYFGFHSFLSIEDATAYRDRRPFICNTTIFECEIPAFSQYYQGYERGELKYNEDGTKAEGNTQHIVSNFIKVIKEVQ